MLNTVLFDMGGTLEDIWYNEETTAEVMKKLQEVLKVNCDISKDFYTFDLSNIRDTRRLLSLEWIAEQDKESER